MADSAFFHSNPSSSQNVHGATSSPTKLQINTHHAATEWHAPWGSTAAGTRPPCLSVGGSQATCRDQQLLQTLLYAYTAARAGGLFSWIRKYTSQPRPLTCIPVLTLAAGCFMQYFLIQTTPQQPDQQRANGYSGVSKSKGVCRLQQQWKAAALPGRALLAGNDHRSPPKPH